jgi:anti-sigma factor RsiW
MMPHIDDGALHAYLDGALTEYPVAEAERIRGHLADCAVCQERLEDARTIRDQAASILGGAIPSVEAPAFEDLRSWAQAGVPSSATGANRLRRMGWAA